MKGKFDTVFLCVKAPDTASATETLAPFVADQGCVVSLQNGLNERVIAAKLGAERTIGAFVNFGADYLVTGTVFRGKERYELFLKLVRVETAEVLAATKARVDLKLGL